MTFNRFLGISDLEAGVTPQAVLGETDAEGMAQVTSVSGIF